MKAVYAAGTDYDNPLSQLKVGELDTPETKPFWSTIHVAAASVNHHDIWSLQGVGLSAEQTPMILGTDASGVLDEDIPVRKGLKAGAEVVLYTFVGTDGAGVMPGERRTILSEKYAGTMAETTQVPSANVFAKPANLTLDEAAALGTSWLTAYSLLFTSANVNRETPCSSKARAAACPQRPSNSPMRQDWKCSSRHAAKRNETARSPSEPTPPSKPARDCRIRSTLSSNRSARPPGAIPSNPYAPAAPSPSAEPPQETSLEPN